MSGDSGIRSGKRFKPSLTMEQKMAKLMQVFLEDRKQSEKEMAEESKRQDEQMDLNKALCGLEQHSS